MPSKTLILLPNQLFREHTDKYDKIILYEHPHFMTKYKYHKSKLVFHRATMKTYHTYLDTKYKQTKIIYIDFNKKIKTTDIDGDVYTYDPINIEIELEMKKKYKCNILDSPLFLLTTKDIGTYKDKYFNTTFYIWMRKKFNILMTSAGKYMGGKLSYDKENRNPFPKTYREDTVQITNNHAIDEATAYINKHFASNYGEINIFLPISYAAAEDYVADFIKTRLKNFGNYEDAFADNVVIGYHSGFSALLNVGLIDVKELVDEITKQANKLPIASVEGFIRQVISWREYMRMMYVKEYENYKDSNFLKHKNPIGENWYRGTTHIIPVDTVIKKALKYSYCHHIERLMVLANFMMLCEIDPADVSRWFLEIVSIDAYEWVMFGNIAMGIYSMGNLLTTRPYFSSSNYILKMSNYRKKDATPIFDGYIWSDVWDALYYNFIANNHDLLKKNYSTAMMVRNYDKKTAAEKKQIAMIASKYIKLYV